jgi:hypothetical protein
MIILPMDVLGDPLQDGAPTSGLLGHLAKHRANAIGIVLDLATILRADEDSRFIMVAIGGVCLLLDQCVLEDLSDIVVLGYYLEGAPPIGVLHLERLILPQIEKLGCPGAAEQVAAAVTHLVRVPHHVGLKVVLF